MFLPLCLIAVAASAFGFHASFNGTRLEDLQEEYDFIVVGAGSAGCRLAERLSSKNTFKVLLIEAGGVPPESAKPPLLASLMYNGPPYDWTYRSVPQKTSMFAARDNVRMINAGRMLGGGSGINTMAYQRGNKEDYDSWETEHGAKGWNFNEVLKLFKEAENSDDPLLSDEYHGRSGPLGVTTHRESHPVKSAVFKAFEEELGLEYSDHNDGNHWGYYDMMSSSKNGRRVSSFNAFIEPNLHRENLDILVHAHVTKVIMKDGHAIGVTFVRDGVSATARTSREVILSSGALRSPQLLMLSGIGDRDHLAEHNVPVVHHLPGVGQNYQDHFGYMGIVAEIPTEGIPDMANIADLHQWLLDQTGPFTYPSGLQMGALYLATGKDKTSPDVEILPFAINNFNYNIDLRQDVKDEFYGPMRTKTNLSMATVLQRPFSRGEVRLASADGLAQPHIDPKWFSHPDDIRMAVIAGRQLVRAMRSKHMRNANVILYEKPFPTCAHLELFSNDYFRCLATHHTMHVFHPAGTCKMGKESDPMAVLDERLRVRGVKGLRVADNSVMPTITVGHLNAPAIMIGSKAGQLILEDYPEVTAKARMAPAKRQEL